MVKLKRRLIGIAGCALKLPAVSGPRFVRFSRGPKCFAAMAPAQRLVAASPFTTATIRSTSSHVL